MMLLLKLIQETLKSDYAEYDKKKEFIILKTILPLKIKKETLFKQITQNIMRIAKFLKVQDQLKF